MRVSKRSNSVNVAGAVAGKLRSGAETTLEVIGLEAMHQAVTALVSATKYLADEKILPVITLTSEARIVADQERQAVIFHIRGEHIND